MHCCGLLLPQASECVVLLQLVGMEVLAEQVLHCLLVLHQIGQGLPQRMGQVGGAVSEPIHSDARQGPWTGLRGVQFGPQETPLWMGKAKILSSQICGLG